MGVPTASFTVTGPVKESRTLGGSGHPAIRNFCSECGSLLFGTPQSDPTLATIYVGSLDDQTIFCPREALFVSQRPPWAKLAAELAEHSALPEQ